LGGVEGDLCRLQAGDEWAFSWGSDLREPDRYGQHDMNPVRLAKEERKGIEWRQSNARQEYDAPIVLNRPSLLTTRYWSGPDLDQMFRCNPAIVSVLDEIARVGAKGSFDRSRWWASQVFSVLRHTCVHERIAVPRELLEVRAEPERGVGTTRAHEATEPLRLRAAFPHKDLDLISGAFIPLELHTRPVRQHAPVPTLARKPVPTRLDMHLWVPENDELTTGQHETSCGAEQTEHYVSIHLGRQPATNEAFLGAGIEEIHHGDVVIRDDVGLPLIRPGEAVHDPFGR